jgi:four helix bundle protein
MVLAPVGGMNQPDKPRGRFEAFEVSLEAVRGLRPVFEAVGRRDSGLAKQMRNAAASVALNLAEGNRRSGGDRLHHFRVAAGSADEVIAALRVADALGYVAASKLEAPLALLDRVLAMTWRLTHRT